jgi:hypothetical protein
MKNFPLLLICLVTLANSPAVRAEDEPAVVRLGADQLEALVSPIALYPDPLIALILPAATHPADIVLAARYLARGADPAAATNEMWDESVKSLVRYREVIDYLDRNLDWTRSLGECFLDQPDDVMNAIQAVRARARANGLLSDTREQEVVVESEQIRIVPADPTLIFVPHYDPQVIFLTSSSPFYRPAAWLTFGIGYGVGTWLSYDCDWRYRSLRIVHRPTEWYGRPDWRRSRPDHPANWTRWTPPPRHHERPRHAPNFMPRYDSTWLNGRPAAPQPGLNEPRRDDDRRDRWQNRPDRETTPREQTRRRQPRETPEPLANPPAVNAIPATPAMPAANTPPPANTSRQERPARPFEHRRNPERNESEPRRFSPGGEATRHAGPAPQPAAARSPSLHPQPTPTREPSPRANPERTVRSDRVEDNRQQLN